MLKWVEWGRVYYFNIGALVLLSDSLVNGFGTRVTSGTMAGWELTFIAFGFFIMSRITDLHTWSKTGLFRLWKIMGI